MFYWEWLISLSMVSSHVIHVATCIRIPFLFKANIPMHVQTTFCLPIHLSVNTWIAPASWLLRIVMLQTWVYKYLSPCFPFFWKFIPRNGIAGSYGSSMFNFLRNIRFSSEASRGHLKIGNNKIHNSQCLPSKCRSVVCETRKTWLSPSGPHREGTLQCSEPHDRPTAEAVCFWGG